jgi:6-phosphogluconate dehydrogenase
MQLGMIGLGKMGANMTTRLLRGGHKVVVFDRSEKAMGEAKEQGATACVTLEAMVKALVAPRTLWIMVPAGAPTEETFVKLLSLCQPGDTIIDGGNSNYKESIERGERAKKAGMFFMDAGTSGGVWGLANGYCLMVGGEEAAAKRCEPIFKTLAPENGYKHVGSVGAGHFSKMVHNGIEYGMMAAYGEGFEILEKSQFGYDLHGLAELWLHGSVIRSWLLELAERAFADSSKLEDIKGYVEDSGEGRWTVLAAIDENVPAPVITASLFSRFTSRQTESFSAKVIAALRNQFGGHAVVHEGSAREAVTTH